MKERKSNYIYMEYLRVLSALAVVLIHVTAYQLSKHDITDPNWIIQIFYNQFGRFSICVFAMISGALFLNPYKEITLKGIFGKYIKRILICYLAWMVIYAVLNMIINKGGLATFAYKLVSQPAHLWYLLMITGLYLVTPVLRLITKDRKLTLYTIWLLIIFGLIFGTIKGLTNDFAAIGEGNNIYSLWTIVLGNLSQLEVSFVPGYLCSYLLGHYIHEYGLGKYHNLFVALAIPSLIISALLTILCCKLTDSYVYTLFLETNPLVVLAAIGIFDFFKRKGNSERVYDKNSKLTKIIIFIGSNTFGIYLVHLAIVDIFKTIGFNVKSYPVIVSAPCNTLLIFTICLVMTVVLKRIPIIRTIVS